MSGLGARQSKKAPFKRCFYCAIRYGENKTPCLMCKRDYEIDIELKSRKVPIYTLITDQWTRMEAALQAKHCEFLPIDMTLEQIGDMAAEWYAESMKRARA